MAASKALPFVETFQFVESLPSPRRAVPNHLLESKIYAKIEQNAVIKASPSVVHFEGIQVGKTYTVLVSLCNVAREVVRIHIIPPQTNAFKIKYTKGERLVPGMTLNCIIEFKADEHRYYYDAVKIHCPGEDNIIIPIHAYPVIDTSSFPTQLKFPQTAIGQRRNHVFTLKCDDPVDFEFKLTKIQDDAAFSVAPMSGTVSGNSHVEIQVEYQPISYCTSTLVLQLDTSQFNFKPSTCTITGYCQPGINALKEPSMSVTQASRKKQVFSPLEKSRQKKTSRKSTKTKPDAPSQKKKQVVDGIRLPEKLNTVHHVSNVLLQTPGKMTLKELIEAEKSVSGRQMKENRFEQAIRKNVYEERQNQLRWQVRLGDSAMPAVDRDRVFTERQHAWALYKELRGDPNPVEERERLVTESVWQRTRRDAQKLAEEGIQFDLYSNNPWSTRHNATDRFTQTARKIILRNRAKKNLRLLNTFLSDWNKKQMSNADEKMPGSGNQKKGVPVIEPDEDPADLLVAKYVGTLSSSNVIHTKYPFFVPPNKKDELAPDALNEVVTYETEIDLVTKTPYFDLQVPQQFKLLGYNEHEVHLGYDYVEPILAQELRSGAQDEVVNLLKPHEAAATWSEIVVQAKNDTTSDQGTSKERPVARSTTLELQIEDVEKHDAEARDKSILSLSPPEAMFKPIEYPSLHIFNATPGLQVFQSPVPYAEVDSDYHLCPLPKYIVHANDPSHHKQTQKQYLDRQDVIKGTMSWKKFPSQGLTSLASTPTLSNVWVPRWNDPFSNDLLPNEVPELQFGLEESDILEHADPDADNDDTIQLTPEMVAAQFGLTNADSQSETKNLVKEGFPYDNKIPSTYLPVSNNGPVPREKREQELDYFLSKKSNRLGQKFQNKTEHLNAITNRSDLVLK